MIVTSYPSNSQIEPVTCNILMDGGNFKTEHHPFIIDGLIFFQQILYRFVNCFGGSSFDDMTYPDFRQFNTFTREYPVGCFPNMKLGWEMVISLSLLNTGTMQSSFKCSMVTSFVLASMKGSLFTSLLDKISSTSIISCCWDNSNVLFALLG